MIANLETEEILATDFYLGKKHDFQLFQDSRTAMAAHISALADSGYQGLTELHSNSKTPAKKS